MFNLLWVLLAAFIISFNYIILKKIIINILYLITVLYFEFLVNMEERIMLMGDCETRLDIPN